MRRRTKLKMTKRGKITLSLMATIFIGVICFLGFSGNENSSNNELNFGMPLVLSSNEQVDFDNQAMEKAKKCVQFYDDNRKMPKMEARGTHQILYDNEHLMLIQKKEDNSIESVVVTNYKWKSGEYEETDNDIWAFVDLFPDETARINRLVYFNAEPKDSDSDSPKEITRKSKKTNVSKSEEKDNIDGFDEFLSLIK